MTITNAAQARMLCVGALKLLQRDGADAMSVDDRDDQFHEWKMVRRGRFCFAEKPADTKLPRRIDAYEVAEIGEKFRLDPHAKLFSLQYRHNGNPPDLHLVVLRSCDGWLGEVMLTLLIASLNATR